MYFKKYIFGIFAFVLTMTIAGCAHSEKIPDRLVVLTFDDASATHYNTVMPLLIEYGFGATFYVCEFPPAFSDTTKFMTWEKIAELDNAGFEIGNHTRTHPNITQITPKEFISELRYIQDKCQEYGIAKPQTFAYPGCSTDSASRVVLKEHGFKLARIGGNKHYDPGVDEPLLVPCVSITEVSDEMMYEFIETAIDGKILVITFHGVPDLQHPWVSLEEERFVRLLDYLKEQNCTVISMVDMLKYVKVD